MYLYICLWPCSFETNAPNIRLRKFFLIKKAVNFGMVLSLDGRESLVFVILICQ